jgi:hypothetical protein
MKRSKKTPSDAEKRWRVERSNERWERRVPYLMERFSGVSVMLPSQITHLKSKGKAPEPANPDRISKSDDDNGAQRE